MSSLWTPGGERPVPRPDDPSARGAAGDVAGDVTDHRAGADEGYDDLEGLTPEEAAERMQQLQEELARTPASTVVANHCFGLFELAALHLSVAPPQLSEAQLAIDALAALVEGLGTRLREYEPQLREGLAQLRLAFVQIKAAGVGAPEPPPHAAPEGGDAGNAGAPA